MKNLSNRAKLFCQLDRVDFEDMRCVFEAHTQRYAMKKQRSICSIDAELIRDINLLGYLNYFAILLFCIGLYACQEEAINRPTTILTTPLSFGVENFTQQERDCEEEAPCFSINLQYPIAQNGKIAVRNTINEFIERSYRQSLIEGQNIVLDSVSNLAHAAQLSIQNFNQFRDQNIGKDIRWKIQSKASLLHQGDEYVSLQIPIQIQKGKSFQKTYTQLISFDTQTAFPIRLSDLMIDTTAFASLCEKYFVEARQKLHPKRPSQLDNFFSGKGLQLPKQYAFAKEGLHCHYNPEEIADTTWGHTYFTIPYAALKGLVDLKYQRH